MIERAETSRLLDHGLDNVIALAERSEPLERIEELKRQRDELAAQLRSGELQIEPEKGFLIALSLKSATYISSLLFTFDWSFVRVADDGLILPDAVVSSRDPTPDVPGTGATFLSSRNAETFVPLDRHAGLLLRPNDRTYELWRSHDETLRGDDATEIFRVLDGQEGAWTEAEVDGATCDALNLLSYAWAHRYVYGHQQDVTATHTAARRRPGRIADLKPRPPRTHILEADPERQGILIETDTIVADEPRR
jgi:hypothetical protein